MCAVRVILYKKAIFDAFPLGGWRRLFEKDELTMPIMVWTDGNDISKKI